jgi:hypothetical protein
MTTLVTDCEELSRGISGVSGLIYRLEKDGGGSFEIGNPIGGN